MQKTFCRVRQLLQDDVKKLGSVNRVALKTGLTNNTIGKYLEGISEPQQITLERIAEVYNTSVLWLRGDTDNPEPVTVSLEDKELLDCYHAMTREQQEAVKMMMTTITGKKNSTAASQVKKKHTGSGLMEVL